MFIFKDEKMLVRDGLLEFEGPPPDAVRSTIGLPATWRDIPAWCEAAEEETGPSVEWLDLRAVWQRWGDEIFARAGTAYQYMNWLRHARFCSSCGSPLSPKEEEKGLLCKNCGRVAYAPLHPAVIVAVERDGKLLLAHNKRMPVKRYSVLAGFVEPGETLEQTIEREVMEEVGIEVQDILYFGSQSWPFPCSLMLGFTARWKKGELRPDGEELNDAGWFTPEEFPEIPTALSISRRLIDNFVSQNFRAAARVGNL